VNCIKFAFYFCKINVTYDIKSDSFCKINVTYDIKSDSFCKINVTYDIKSDSFCKINVTYDIKSDSFCNWFYIKYGIPYICSTNNTSLHKNVKPM
jgi:hypothetical protein